MSTRNVLLEAGRWSVLSTALWLGACQSVPGPDAALFDAARAMPGEATQVRYAYLASAISELGEALASRSASFEGIAFAPDLYRDAPGVTGSDVPDRHAALQRLVATELANAGPYRLVTADPHGNRIEFRSLSSDQHLSFTVQEASGNTATAGAGYTVTEVFGQVSLRAMTQRTPMMSAGASPRDIAPVPLTALRRLTQDDSLDDAGMLRYYNALPRQEREREDILRLRALLSFRLEKLTDARSLVQSGIVRYPDSPSFFLLAERLFQRAGDGAHAAPSSLTAILQHRFDARHIADSRRRIEAYLQDGS